jgi:transglutaminase-like putative cysteine protease
MVVTGCALFRTKPASEEILSFRDTERYAEFVRWNIAALNHRYTLNYVAYDFVVDTEYGSTLIQNLIDTQAMTNIIRQLGVEDHEADSQVAMISDYIRREYAFVDEPEKWATAQETLLRKRGDCKNLSILLLSMLIHADVEAYGAVSNGHMWVNAFFNGDWHVIETDPGTARTSIYQIPGFYEYPLYKVYPDRTVKRERISPDG